MRSFPRALALATALLVAPLAPAALSRTAFAQEEAPPPPDPVADWQESFQRGIDLLREHKHDDSIKAFERCRLIKADREPSLLDYNIACAYAQKKDAGKAVERLKKAFDAGFLDMEHVGRDEDLDPIRADDAFVKLFQTTKKKILEHRTAALRIVPKSQAKGPRPLVVFLAPTGDSPDDYSVKLGSVADDLGAVVLVVAGNKSADGGRTAWDSTAETCVVADVGEALADSTLGIDPSRVVLVGQFGSATIALDTALAHGWKRIVGAAGLYRVPEAKEAKDARVYLIAPRGLNDRAQTEATALRNSVLVAGGQAVVERPESREPFGPDLPGTLKRAVHWLLGDTVTIPGAGESKKF